MWYFDLCEWSNFRNSSSSYSAKIKGWKVMLFSWSVIGLLSSVNCSDWSILRQCSSLRTLHHVWCDQWPGLASSYKSLSMVSPSSDHLISQWEHSVESHVNDVDHWKGSVTRHHWPLVFPVPVTLLVTALTWISSN